MNEYEKILKDYVKLHNTMTSCWEPQLRLDLKEFLDTYFKDTICEYSMNNKMSLEEIIGYQIATSFCYCRHEDFKELLNEFLDNFNEE